MYIEVERMWYDRFPVMPVSVGKSCPQKRVDRLVHGYGWHQFLWVLEGEGQYRTPDGEGALRAGEGLFTRAGEQHLYEPAPAFSTMWVTFSGGEQLLEYYGVGQALHFEAPRTLSAAGEELERFCRSAPSPAVRSSHLYAFLVELLEEILPKEDAFADRVVRFLEQNCQFPLTLDRIAGEVGMDRFSLCHRYKRQCGESVMQTLRRIRLRKARRLLRYTVFSVEEVGRLCGFESPGYFIGQFRRDQGCTPAVYRRQRQELT